MLIFIRKHVMQQEEWYVFYNRRHLRHNEEYSNTPLEGTNNTIKHSASSTHPQLKLGNAMRILCEQSDQKMAIKHASHNVKTDKFSTHYENGPVHNNITLLASSKLWSLFQPSRNFKCLRIQEKVWKVCRICKTEN